jgi:CBS domain containing-hemolysin-like protein
VTSIAAFWLLMAAIAGTALAAAGVQSLRTFSRHDLETYCRRRRSRRFTEFVTRHEDVALGVECFQVALTVLAAAAAVVLASARETSLVDPRALSVLGGAVAALLLATIVLPHALAGVAAVPLLYHLWPLWRVLSLLAVPVTWWQRILAGRLKSMAGRGQRTDDDEEEAFEDEIRSIVSAGLRDGLLEEDTGDMIESVMELGDADVADIMTPRSHIDAADVNTDWPDLLEHVISAGRTRLPVYEGSLDNIVGILFVKDLFAELAREEPHRRSLRKLAREAWFTPKTTRLDELLREFLRTRMHLAVVVDEYGAVEGVVTIEDVLEEIVGEIMDESDRDQVLDIVQVAPFAADADGRSHVADINELFGLELPDGDDYDSVGGLVTSRLGRLPQVGESVIVDGVRLTVQQASDRRVVRVRVEWEPENGNWSNFSGKLGNLDKNG